MHLMYSLVKVRNRPRRSRSSTGPEMGWLYDWRRVGASRGAPAPDQASRERGVLQVVHLCEALDHRPDLVLLVAPARQLLAQLGPRVCPGSQQPDPCVERRPCGWTGRSGRPALAALA